MTKTEEGHTILAPKLAYSILKGDSGLLALLARILVDRCDGEDIVESGEKRDFFIDAEFVRQPTLEEPKPPVRIFARVLEEPLKPGLCGADFLGDGRLCNEPKGHPLGFHGWHDTERRRFPRTSEPR